MFLKLSQKNEIIWKYGSVRIETQEVYRTHTVSNPYGMEQACIVNAVGKESCFPCHFISVNLAKTDSTRFSSW